MIQWLAQHRFDSGVSILALGEVECGIVNLPDGNRRRQLTIWFNYMATEMEDSGRVIRVNRELLSHWARVHIREERLTKRKPPFVDSMMAAAAEMHGLTMVTRNVKDFPASLPVINPWDA